MLYEVITLSYITVKVVDEKGNFCATASNNIQFEISGDGKLAGVGNGDAASLTSLQGNKMEVFNGLALAIVQGAKNPETPITLTRITSYNVCYTKLLRFDSQRPQSPVYHYVEYWK